MLVKLRAPHVIGDVVRRRGEVVDVRVVTPLMEGLDAAAVEAIREEKVRVFGRWVNPFNHYMGLIDDPPIDRPLEECQPVEAVPAAGPPG